MEGGEADPRSIPLGTRHTRHIPNSARPEWDPDDLRDGLARCLKDFPLLQTRSITATYNCVGMALASRRTWVDPDQVPLILSDDGYTQLATEAEARVGDLVLYKDASGQIRHIGVVIQRIENIASATVGVKILSKWGPWAEFVHDPRDVYMSWGTPSEYWTDRKAV